MIQPRRVRLAGNVAQIGQMSNAYTVLEAILEDRGVNWRIVMGL
jgi:hypothetical protein